MYCPLAHSVSGQGPFRHFFCQVSQQIRCADLLKKNLLLREDYLLKDVEPMTGFEPVTSSLPRKHSTPELHRPQSGAEDGGRTRDIQLGRLTLYQLSYFRMICQNYKNAW